MDWATWGDRHKEKPGASPVVFLPGWGCSGRMLSLCAAGPPWWSTVGQVDPAVLDADLLQLCRRKGWKRFILVGWSLGARLALDFARRHPEMVESLILLAIRKSWPEPEIAAIRAGLSANSAAFLKDFYRKCMLGRKEQWRQFVEGYLEDELREADLLLLEKGLDKLREPLSPIIGGLGRSGFPPAGIWLLHGENDIVAPCPERLVLEGARQLVVKREGHCLFLAPSVRDFTILDAAGADQAQQ